jgi:hypothetical protein
LLFDAFQGLGDAVYLIMIKEAFPIWSSDSTVARCIKMGFQELINIFYKLDQKVNTFHGFGF